MQNAELACEVTLQPLRRYALDAAILFSDILTIPDAMGLGLYFEAGEGPRFHSPITSHADVVKLPVPDPEQELGYVMNACERSVKISPVQCRLSVSQAARGRWRPIWWKAVAAKRLPSSRK